MLKGLAVSAGSLLGLGGTAAADEKSEVQRKTEAAMDGYDTRAGVNTVLDEHADDLLTELAGSSFLASSGTEDFRTGGVNVHEAPAEVDPDEGTYVTASEYDGTFSAHISVVKKTPTHVVRVNVRPQLGDSFASIKTRDGDLVSLVSPSEGTLSAQSAASDDDATIQKMCGQDGYTCPPGVCCTTCSVMVKHERICCVYADGSQDCYTQPINKCCEPLVCC